MTDFSLYKENGRWHFHFWGPVTPDLANFADRYMTGEELIILGHRMDSNDGIGKLPEGTRVVNIPNVWRYSLTPKRNLREIALDVRAAFALADLAKYPSDEMVKVTQTALSQNRYAIYEFCEKMETQVLIESERDECALVVWSRKAAAELLSTSLRSQLYAEYTDDLAETHEGIVNFIMERWENVVSVDTHDLVRKQDGTRILNAKVCDVEGKRADSFAIRVKGSHFSIDPVWYERSRDYDEQQSFKKPLIRTVSVGAVVFVVWLILRLYTLLNR